VYSHGYRIMNIYCFDYKHVRSEKILTVALSMRLQSGTLTIDVVSNPLLSLLLATLLATLDGMIIRLTSLLLSKSNINSF